MNFKQIRNVAVSSSKGLFFGAVFAGFVYGVLKINSHSIENNVQRTFALKSIITDTICTDNSNRIMLRNGNDKTRILSGTTLIENGEKFTLSIYDVDFRNKQSRVRIEWPGQNGRIISVPLCEKINK